MVSPLVECRELDCRIEAALSAEQQHLEFPPKVSQDLQSDHVGTHSGLCRELDISSMHSWSLHDMSLQLPGRSCTCT
jgi:hypothetical protein